VTSRSYSPSFKYIKMIELVLYKSLIDIDQELEDSIKDIRYTN